jgi:hypothetical protein
MRPEHWGVVMGNQLFRRTGERFEALPLNDAVGAPQRRASHWVTGLGELWLAVNDRLWRRDGGDVCVSLTGVALPAG